MGERPTRRLGKGLELLFGQVVVAAFVPQAARGNFFFHSTQRVGTQDHRSDQQRQHGRIVAQVGPHNALPPQGRSLAVHALVHGCTKKPNVQSGVYFIFRGMLKHTNHTGLPNHIVSRHLYCNTPIYGWDRWDAHKFDHFKFEIIQIYSTACSPAPH